jgi:hypothetical protein
LYRKHAVHIKVSQDHYVQIPAVLLTKVGREVAKILDPIDSIERAKELVNLLPKQSVAQISYVEVYRLGEKISIGNPVVLWEPDKKEDSPIR